MGRGGRVHYFISNIAFIHGIAISMHHNDAKSTSKGNHHMPALIRDSFAERIPTEIDVQGADQLRRILASSSEEGQPTVLELASQGPETASIALSPALANTLLDVLRLVSSGKGFQIIPLDSQLTTQQAADYLNVSRPFLIKLLEEGRISFSKVGRHRRIRAEDLFAFKAARDSDRAQALDNLARMDAESGLF